MSCLPLSVSGIIYTDPVGHKNNQALRPQWLRRGLDDRLRAIRNAEGVIHVVFNDALKQ
jgi:hypothetical protein